MSSPADCQCGVLHHPITLCTPVWVRGARWCFVHPQVCIHLCRFLVSSEVHRCVDYATRFLWGDKHCQRDRVVEEVWSINIQSAFKNKWQWITEATCSLFSTYRGLLFQWLTQSFSIFVYKEKKQFHFASIYPFQKNAQYAFCTFSLTKLLTRLFTFCLDSVADHSNNWSDQNHHCNWHNDS